MVSQATAPATILGLQAPARLAQSAATVSCPIWVIKLSHNFMSHMAHEIVQPRNHLPKPAPLAAEIRVGVANEPMVDDKRADGVRMGS